MPSCEEASIEKKTTVQLPVNMKKCVCEYNVLLRYAYDRNIHTKKNYIHSMYREANEREWKKNTVTHAEAYLSLKPRKKGYITTVNRYETGKMMRE